MGVYLIYDYMTRRGERDKLRLRPPSRSDFYMIITIVADVFGRENNGTCITARRLIDNLKARGYEVRVVSPYSTEENGFYTVPKRNFYCFNNYVAKNGVELAKPDRETLKKAIAGSDIVHIMMPFKLGRAALSIATKMNIPCTAAFHCQPENFSSHIFMKDFKPVNDYLYNRFNRKLYKRVGHVHCPSEYIATELTAHGYKSKLHVISNGVAPVYRREPSVRPAHLEGRFLILFTGRFVDEKRHDILIKGVALSAHRDEITIVCAGGGPKREKIEKLARHKGVPMEVGFYKPEELNKVINYCDLYVHPADVEIEAIAALEAITCGLVPVINNSPRSATRFFALDERSLFDGTPEDLAKKIDYWFEHHEEKAAQAEKYVEYAERFRIDRSIDLMEKMFIEAAEEHKAKVKSKK